MSDSSLRLATAPRVDSRSSDARRSTSVERRNIAAVSAFHSMILLSVTDSSIAKGDADDSKFQETIGTSVAPAARAFGEMRGGRI